MQRAVPWLVPLTLGGLAVATLVSLVAPVRSSRVYSVAAARAALLHRSDVWVGRTLSVRGRLDGCPPAPMRCPVWQPRLFAVDGASPRISLPVVPVLSDALPAPLLAALQGLPVLSALVSPRHVVRWGAVATYQVQLAVLRTRSCATGACDIGDTFDVFTCDTRTCYKVLLVQAGL